MADKASDAGGNDPDASEEGSIAAGADADLAEEDGSDPLAPMRGRPQAIRTLYIRRPFPGLDGRKPET